MANMFDIGNRDEDENEREKILFKLCEVVLEGDGEKVW